MPPVILFYDPNHNRFIKTTEAIYPGISASTNGIMRHIRAGDSCKDANDNRHKVGLYLQVPGLAEFIYNIYGIVGLPAGVTSIGTGSDDAANIERQTFACFSKTKEEYMKSTSYPHKYFWDCGHKPSTGTMVMNLATELDPHEAGVAGDRVDTNLTITNEELYLIGLSPTLVGTNGIVINESLHGPSAFTQYQICDIDLLGYAGSTAGLRQIFGTSENSHKNEYIAQTRDDPFGVGFPNSQSSIAPDASSLPLKIKFLSKEMGDTFQAISLNKCLTIYPGIDPMTSFLYTCDKGTLVSCIQLGVPCAAKIGTEHYIYPGYVTITQGDIELIVDNYIDTAINLVKHGINFVIHLIDNFLSNHIGHLLIDGNEFEFNRAANSQECLNFYRLGMYRLLLYYKGLKTSILQNRDNILRLTQGIGELTAYAQANAGDQVIVEACENDKSVLANFIKDYYLKQVIERCFTCNQIGGKSGRLQASFRLLQTPLATADKIINLYDPNAAPPHRPNVVPVPSFTPNLDSLHATRLGGLGFPNINARWVSPSVTDTYEYACFKSLCGNNTNIANHECILLSYNSCRINNTDNIVREIRTYMTVTGNELYPLVSHLLAQGPLYQYNCIPIDVNVTAVVNSIDIKRGGNLKKSIKNKLKKSIKNKLKRGGMRLLPPEVSYLGKTRINSGLSTPHTKRRFMQSTSKPNNKTNLNMKVKRQLRRMTNNELRSRKKQVVQLGLPPPPLLDKLQSIVHLNFDDEIRPDLIQRIIPSLAENMGRYHLERDIIYANTYQNIIPQLMVYAPFSNSTSIYLHNRNTIITEEILRELSQITGEEITDDFFAVLRNPDIYSVYYNMVIRYINDSYDNAFAIHQDIYSLFFLFHLTIEQLYVLIRNFDCSLLINFKQLYALIILLDPEPTQGLLYSDINLHELILTNIHLSIRSIIEFPLVRDAFLFCMQNVYTIDFTLYSHPEICLQVISASNIHLREDQVLAEAVPIIKSFITREIEKEPRVDFVLSDRTYPSVLELFILIEKVQNYAYDTGLTSLNEAMTQVNTFAQARRLSLINSVDIFRDLLKSSQDRRITLQDALDAYNL